ncbi:hypothetical protein GQ600_25587 [Phytophthora cactorum]|nr:hypothetical protein GQ600_25587 [Phytophthora cactorum]
MDEAVRGCIRCPIPPCTWGRPRVRLRAVRPSLWCRQRGVGVAPECFPRTETGKKDYTLAKPTFASDVHSLGMCVVEALRVVQAARSGKSTQSLFPWSNPD